MENNLQTFDPRRAGVIERYHAQTHVSRQTVGEHTWQVLRILTTIWPDIPKHVLIYAIYHDIAEGVTGDAPYTLKLGDARIKKLMDESENIAYAEIQKHWNIPDLPSLSDDEKKIFKACELIEMAEYAMYEMNLGNKYAKVVYYRLAPRIRDVEFECNELTTAYHKYCKARVEFER
jgi:5'-deoxynucleotidase YfbR-like HD superfamily hydrolase